MSLLEAMVGGLRARLEEEEARNSALSGGWFFGRF